MWELHGKQLDPSAIGDLKPVEILFEFEEPLTFVCLDKDDQKLLAHCLCDGPGINRYLVVPTDDRILKELKTGRIDILSAIQQPRCWIVDFEAGWKIKQIHLISFDKIPGEVLPKPGAMLSPDFEPLYRTIQI